jgi:hypothetical protein
MIRSDLKKVFRPYIGVGRSFSILEMTMYSSGGDPQAMINQAENPALAGNLPASRIWNPNPNLGIASIPRLEPYPLPAGEMSWP